MVIALFCIAVLQLAVAAISEEIAALACLVLSFGAEGYCSIVCWGALPGAVAIDYCEVAPDVSGVLAPWG